MTKTLADHGALTAVAYKLPIRPGSDYDAVLQRCIAAGLVELGAAGQPRLTAAGEVAWRAKWEVGNVLRRAQGPAVPQGAVAEPGRAVAHAAPPARPAARKPAPRDPPPAQGGLL